MTYRKSFVNALVSTPPGRTDATTVVSFNRASQSGGILVDIHARECACHMLVTHSASTQMNARLKR